MLRKIIVCFVLLFASTDILAESPTFSIQFSKELHPQPYSGRVLILFSRIRTQPRLGPSWFRPERFIALDVEQWKPGEPLVIEASNKQLLSFPEPLKKMDLDGYRAQAVVRFNPHTRKVGTGAGNGFSETVVLDSEALSKRVSLTVNQTSAAREFRSTKWTKLLRVRSELLSKFHNREVFMLGSVTLPASYYDSEDKRYPTIFTIPGFGGTHHRRPRTSPVTENNEHGVEFLRVTLDPSCPLGHHVFADSANNGPVGRALIEELIPAFQKQFRAVDKPEARLLTGHSSGGWSSLWLQVTYPDFFGGTWSTAPDPVDFRDFQRIDIYEPEQNMYRDSSGAVRPLARRGDQVVLTFESFASMEWVLGYGGQLHSFEAVFSPRGDDGKPELLWSRDTGKLNPAVAKAWRKYDIRLILEENWKTLSPKLKGKIRVITGELDTFYLEGAVRLLKKSLADLGSDAVVEIHPGKNHSSILTRELRDRIYREMVDAVRTDSN